MTGIRVEKRRLKLPPGTTVLGTFCVDDPLACCGVAHPCWPGVVFPRRLYLHLWSPYYGPALHYAFFSQTFPIDYYPNGPQGGAVPGWYGNFTNGVGSSNADAGFAGLTVRVSVGPGPLSPGNMPGTGTGTGSYADEPEGCAGMAGFYLFGSQLLDVMNCDANAPLALMPGEQVPTVDDPSIPVYFEFGCGLGDSQRWSPHDVFRGVVSSQPGALMAPPRRTALCRRQLPPTLTATLTAAACPSLGGQDGSCLNGSYTLTFRGGAYYADVTRCGQTVHLGFFMSTSPMAASPQFHVVCGNAGSSNTGPGTVVSCDPFVWVFNGLVATSGTATCWGTAPFQIACFDVVVTE